MECKACFANIERLSTANLASHSENILYEETN